MTHLPLPENLTPQRIVSAASRIAEAPEPVVCHAVGELEDYEIEALESAVVACREWRKTQA